MVIFVVTVVSSMKTSRQTLSEGFLARGGDIKPILLGSVQDFF